MEYLDKINDKRVGQDEDAKEEFLHRQNIAVANKNAKDIVSAIDKESKTTRKVEVTNDQTDKVVSSVSSLTKEVGVLKDALSKAIESLDKSGSSNTGELKKSLEAAFKTIKIENVQQTDTLEVALKGVAEALKKIDVKPVVNVEAPIVNVPETVVNVPQTKVEVKETKIDVTPIVDAVERLESAFSGFSIEIPQNDYTSLQSAVQDVTQSIKNIRFPIPNYVLPFKGANGEGEQVQLDNGSVPVVNPDGSSIAKQYDDGEARDTATGTLLMGDDGTNVQSVRARDVNTQVVSGDVGIVTNSVIHGKTTAGGGSFVDVKVTPSGALLTEIDTISSAVIDPLDGYNYSNIEEGATYTYIGYENASGAWAIKRLTVADDTMLYAKGASGYATAWTNRASQTYASFDTTFDPITGSVITSATSINSVLQGTQDSGTIVDIPVTPEGHLEVAIHGPLNPFGSVHVEELSPVFQSDAIYGVNPQQMVATTGLGYDPGPAIGSNSGSATTVNNMFRCSTGTTAYSFGALQTRRRLRYRPGQGIVGRFTALWSAPSASTTVVAGLGSGESGYYLGYNGTSFGILQSSGGVREIQTFTVSAACSTGGTATFRLNGLDTQVTLATSATTTLTANDIATNTFPGWDVEAIGATVVFTANSVGNKAGAFTFTLGTALGAAGSFAETLAGVASTDTWVAQTAWNGDKCDGTGASGFTLDKTKGNVFQIDIAWLGFGPVTFKIMMPSSDSNNATWTVVHTINNPNALTAPHTSQPSFPFTMAAYSAGSTTNVSVSVGSVAGFIEGHKKLTGPRFSYGNTAGVTSSTSAYTPLFSIRNSNVFGGRANQAVVNLLSVGGAAASNTGITSFYVIRNGTLTGGAWSQYSTTSSTYINTTATAVTFANNNQQVWSGTIAKDGNFVFSFSDEVTVQPGETITLAVRSVTATANTVGQLNTREDQ